MPEHNEFHCPICRAEFASQAELELHNKARHTQQGLSGVIPSNEYLEDADAARKDADSGRKDRDFTRRNPE